MEDLPPTKIHEMFNQFLWSKGQSLLEIDTERSLLIRVLKGAVLWPRMYKKGFTMLEVIIATLIVAIVAAGVASAFWGSQHFLNRSRHRIQAYNFAVEALDKLRSNYQYSSDPAMAIGVDHAQTEIDAGGVLKGEIADLGGTLRYDITEPQVNGYKQVTIKVHWDEPSL